MPYYLIALLVLALDQASKFLVVRYMELGQSIPVWEPVLYITSHRNRGAAFGILQGQQILFIGVTVVVVAGILYYLAKARPPFPTSLSLSLVLGGAVGNFIDRTTRGEVVDFIAVWIGSYQYPIFNVADSAVVVGVLLLLWTLFRDERKGKEREASPHGETEG